MLNSALMSSLDFVSSFKMIFIRCLLTWVSYWVKFKIETMCTIVFHWFSCVSMRDEIHFLMYLMSLVVAVPVNHFRAEPRKGRRLRFFHPDGGRGLLSNDGCVCSMLLVDENTGLYAMKRLCRLSNST